MPDHPVPKSRVPVAYLLAVPGSVWATIQITKWAAAMTPTMAGLIVALLTSILPAAFATYWMYTDWTSWPAEMRRRFPAASLTAYRLRPVWRKGDFVVVLEARTWYPFPLNLRITGAVEVSYWANEVKQGPLHPCQVAVDHEFRTNGTWEYLTDVQVPYPGCPAPVLIQARARIHLGSSLESVNVEAVFDGIVPPPTHPGAP